MIYGKVLLITPQMILSTQFQLLKNSNVILLLYVTTKLEGSFSEGIIKKI